MDEVQAITSLGETLGLIGFLLLSLRYLDTRRAEERLDEKERTQDIVDDWKRMRKLDETENFEDRKNL